MLIDAHKAPPERLETDVAIIGSGPAGLTLALALDAQGISAVVLEAGGEGFDKAGQEFYRAASIAPDTHGPIHLYRRRAFGGSSAVWGGRCIPFEPIDFEARPWLPDARWPIGHDEVAAYYPRALEICRAGPAEFDAEHALPKEGAPLVDGVASADVILDRVERFSEPTHFGRAYRQRLEASPHVTLVTHAPTVEILTDETGQRCLGVAARTPSGATLTVAARRTVVAAGGIETPRLLLASNRAKACGLGNERDVVGRYYQTHIEGDCGEIRFTAPARDVRLDYGRSPQGIYCRRYIWLSPEAQRREQVGQLIARPTHSTIVDPAHGDPVRSAMYLVKDMILPEYARKMTSAERYVKAAFAARGARLMPAHVMNIVRHPARLAGFSVDWARRRTFATRKLPSVVLRDRRNLYPLDINAEQSPDRDSRIMLGAERDPLGLPRAAISWRLAGEDRARIARGMRVLQGAFAGSGTSIDLSRLDEQVAELTGIGGHHIGTARMSDDPATGVVDGDGAVFGTAGLYLAGAATFPTSSFANPTLTIVALALRLGDHLAATAQSRGERR